MSPIDPTIKLLREINIKDKTAQPIGGKISGTNLIALPGWYNFLCSAG